MQAYKKRKTIFKVKARQALCLLLSMAVIMSNIPTKVNAAVNPLKYIYAEHQAFVPSMGETTTIRSCVEITCTDSAE